MEKSGIIGEGGQAETEVKKSRFIAIARAVHTEEEALALVAGQRKQYWSASHHCYAFILGDRGQIMRCSDDGEPQGTAGRPILDVLTGAGLRDACVVVTRYFGGTLLGTGGLVRAYTDAALAALGASRIMDRIRGRAVTLCVDYGDLGKVQYLLAKEQAAVQKTDYADKVRFALLIPEKQAPGLKALLTEATGGRALLEEERQVWYAQSEGDMVILEET